MFRAETTKKQNERKKRVTTLTGEVFMLQVKNDAEYSNKLHAAELEIMDAIVHACENLGLRYVIYAGSLLGAIRHKGFIPWDDDIDIIMPREDYEIFISEAHKYMECKFVIQHYSNEKNTNVGVKQSFYNHIELLISSVSNILA